MLKPLHSPVIAPSILAADHACFGEEARRAEKAGGDWLHVDVMDGHFVPNISFGPAVTAALKHATKLPLDVHLMIEHPDKYVETFHKAGAWRITVHVEAPHPVGKTLQQIKKLGRLAGLAINPNTPARVIEKFLPQADLVLCMTVYPGFGGQKFIPEVLKKVRFLADHPLRAKNNYWIEVDGGINLETARESAQAGADAFVAGTSLFKEKNMAKAMAEMRKQCKI